MNFRILERRDIDNTVNLMNKIKPDIAGSRDPSFYRILCEDSFKDYSLVFIVGEQDGINAFTLSVIDPDGWKINFAMRHPFIASKLALQKALERFRPAGNGKPQVIPDYIFPLLSKEPTSKSWDDSAPDIAKILFSGVDETCRGKGVAKEMMKFFIGKLACFGVTRVDSTILYDNIASIKVKVAHGFTIYNKGDQLFLTREIDLTEWCLLPRPRERIPRLCLWSCFR
jgi:GNAT superfamily N-acetyltransferase